MVLKLQAHMRQLPWLAVTLMRTDSHTLQLSSTTSCRDILHIHGAPIRGIIIRTTLKTANMSCIRSVCFEISIPW
jgi:hypothetical protein